VGLAFRAWAFRFAQDYTNIAASEIVLQERNEGQLSIRSNYPVPTQKVKYLLRGIAKISEVVLDRVLPSKDRPEVPAMQDATTPRPELADISLFEVGATSVLRHVPAGECFLWIYWNWEEVVV
jgi:hypothetical protein